ncbi:hypothetical protein CRG98_003904 [Punica granatum]|uniref:Uncharacterized protein n=1 Tax=Punica granatum TaxID=22663 RepID=A0A2I0L4S6_PUNGR|nr:hypothetical protein CRG98_003904 [Punica granatum]
MSLISPCVVWTDVRATRRLGSRFCPVWTFGVEFSVPRSPIVLCACLHSFWRSFCPVGDRWPVVLGRGPLAREDLGTLTGILSVCPECLEVLGDYLDRARLFASGCRVMNSVPSFGRESPCGKPVGQNGGSANLQCRKVSSHGLADPARLQQARARWLYELAVQENLERLQEARARSVGELARQESKIARISRLGEVARGTSVVAQWTCGAGKLARTGWQTRQGCKGHERGGSANLRCRKVSSHGLADPARLQGARARWLGELAVQESKLARMSRPGKITRGTREVARRTCGAGK